MTKNRLWAVLEWLAWFRPIAEREPSVVGEGTVLYHAYQANYDAIHEIICREDVTPELRKFASGVLRNCAAGKLKPFSGRALKSFWRMEKIADRVLELEKEHGNMESAVNHAAKEFKCTERWIWQAVGARQQLLERERQSARYWARRFGY